MSIATLIRRMTELGCPNEAIALAVEEIEAVQTALDARRHADRDRKRAQREGQKAANVTGHSEDGHADVTGIPLSPLVPPKVFPEPLSNNPPISPKPQPTKASAKFDLPGDIPAEPFAAFVEMRRKIRKPLSDHGKHLIVLRLRKLRDDEGWPPGDVLNHSTMNSYQGLFPPQKDRNNGQSRSQSPGVGATERAMRTALASIEGRAVGSGYSG